MSIGWVLYDETHSGHRHLQFIPDKEQAERSYEIRKHVPLVKLVRLLEIPEEDLVEVEE